MAGQALRLPPPPRVRPRGDPRLRRCRRDSLLAATRPDGGGLPRAGVRNVLASFFGSSVLFVLALLGLAALYLGALLLLVVGAVSGRAGTAAWTWLPVLEVGLGLVPRALSDRRAGYPAWLTLLHPLAIASLVGMGLESVACFRGRRVVHWRGRGYPVTNRAG